jgi:hypothetical protein
MVWTLSKSGRVISIVIALMLVMGITVICGIGASADNAPKSIDAQINNTDVAQDGVKIERIPVSDAMALKVVERAFGPEIAARAKHRLTKAVKIDYYASISPEWEKSVNWCGYWLKNDDLKNIRANFNASACTDSGDIHDVTWVGIGGHGEPILIQTGLEQRRMQLFYEVWPDSMYVWGDEDDVNEGDEIHSTVQNWYGNHYYLCSVNATTGDYYTRGYTLSPNPSGRGEWIVETPMNQGVQCHMGDFNDVTFTDALWWGDDNQTHPINYAGEDLHRIYMYNTYQEMMVPSVLQGGGTSFTVHPY